jgi:hypothetical protein
MVTVLALLSFGLACIAAPSDPLRFERLGPREFGFNTGELKGKLGGADYARGLSAVTHIRSGRRLDSSLGLLSHYRVFTTGRRYGAAAWEWPAEYALQEDGSVLAKWAGSPDRPFDLLAHYRWLSPTNIEVKTTVVAQRDLEKFESFLASYFTVDFDRAWICAGTPPDAGPQQMFVEAVQSRGVWQAFPRDAFAAMILNDGRWKLDPHPVGWILQEPFRKPLAVRTAVGPGLSAAIISNPEDCFAICTPHQSESHYSTYLSLFGVDLKAGEKKTASVGLFLLGKFDPAEIWRLSHQ